MKGLSEKTEETCRVGDEFGPLKEHRESQRGPRGSSQGEVVGGQSEEEVGPDFQNIAKSFDLIPRKTGKNCRGFVGKKCDPIHIINLAFLLEMLSVLGFF